MAISLVQASQFTISSPKTTQENNSFFVSINSNISGIYDIKIYVEDPNSSPKTISEIYNNEEWQSSYFYLKNDYPNQTKFKLRIIKSGNWSLCGRLRGQDSYGPVCNSILVSINPNDKSQNNNNNNNNNSEINQPSENKNFTNEINPVENKKSNTITKNQTKIKTNQITHKPILLNSKKTDSPILLNSKTNKPIKIKPKITRTGIENSYLFYAFTALCILIIIILALNKL